MPNDNETTTPTSSESSQSNQLSEDLLTTLEEESLTNSLTTTNEVLDPTISSGSSLCSAQCCDDYSKAFQPKDEFTIKSLKSTGPAGKTRSFQTSWYGQFPWISVCVTRKRVFCLYCQHAENYQLLTFSRCGEKVFTEVGFQNWKKAREV